MQEYMLLIRNDADSKSTFSPEDHLSFVNACKDYINQLTSEEKLIGAQPMVREGVMLSNTAGEWQAGPFSTSKEVIVGYYHIRASDMNEAIEIAKGNPEFSYTNTVRIEIRPLKTIEKDNNFTYPKH